MARADYTYSIESYQGRNIIQIEDLNLGNMSVTNDIENVLSEIGRVEKIDPSSYMVVYKDSTGDWDGFDFKSGNFIALTEESWQDAVTKYVQIQIQNAA